MNTKTYLVLPGTKYTAKPAQFSVLRGLTLEQCVVAHLVRYKSSHLPVEVRNAFDTDNGAEIIVETAGAPETATEVFFKTKCGRYFLLQHFQDCCEEVYVEDINGELSDLIGSPIAQAEENSNENLNPSEENNACLLWTFYRLATNRGAVVIRWYGSSNGDYSMDVSFQELFLKK